MASRYKPICALPHPPYDVSVPVGVVWGSASGVLVHLVPVPAWVAGVVLALVAGLAVANRRAWQRAVQRDPGRDLYPLLFWPSWRTALVVLGGLFAAALPGTSSVAGVFVGFALLGVASALPSAWLATWLGGAAARGGPLPPGSRARRLVGLGVWRTAAAVLWPVEYFGVFDTMGSRVHVAAALTALCWLAVAAVSAAQLRGRRPVAGTPRIAVPADAVERDYREPQERYDPAPEIEEPDLRAVLAPELRRGAWVLLAVTVPLVLHAVLIFV